MVQRTTVAVQPPNRGVSRNESSHQNDDLRRVHTGVLWMDRRYDHSDYQPHHERSTTMITKLTVQTMNTLRTLGYKWTFATKVEHRIELFREVERLDGRTEIHFVAELDEYGNVTDFGDYDNVASVDPNGAMFNADGDVVQ